MKSLIYVIGILLAVFISILYINCSNKTDKNKDIEKSFAEVISKLPYDKDSLASAVDIMTNNKFKYFLKEKTFNRIDSLNIIREGFKRGYRIGAFIDTLYYNPIIATIPSGFSDEYFQLIYATGKMDIDYFKIIINYKAPNGGYAFTSTKELSSTTVGYIGYGNFYGTDGKKMPSGLKPMDIMTIYRIKSRSKVDTSITFVDLTRE